MLLRYNAAFGYPGLREHDMSWNHELESKSIQLLHAGSFRVTQTRASSKFIWAIYKKIVQ